MEDIPYDIGSILYSINKETNLFDSSKKLHKFKKGIVKYEKYEHQFTFKSTITKMVKVCEWLEDKKYYLIKDMIISSYKFGLDYFCIFLIVFCNDVMDEKDIEILKKKIVHLVDEDRNSFISVLDELKTKSPEQIKLKFKNATTRRNFIEAFKKRVEVPKLSNLLNYINITRNGEEILNLYQQSIQNATSISSDILTQEEKIELSLIKNSILERSFMYSIYESRDHTLDSFKYLIYMNHNSYRFINNLNNYMNTFLGRPEEQQYMLEEMYRCSVSCLNCEVIPEIIKHLSNRNRIEYIFECSYPILTKKLYSSITSVEEVDKKRFILSFARYSNNKEELIEIFDRDLELIIEFCEEEKEFEYSNLVLYFIRIKYKKNIDLEINNRKSLFNLFLRKMIKTCSYMNLIDILKKIYKEVNWEFVIEELINKGKYLHQLRQVFEVMKNDTTVEQETIILIKTTLKKNSKIY